MADPDWIGPPVEDAWWAWDGRRVQYTLKRDGASIRDTYQQSIDGSAAAERIDGATRATLDGVQPVYDAQRARAAFVRNGDVFVRDLRSGTLTQLTRSDVDEARPQWGRDGGLVWRVSNDWYRWDGKTVAQATIVKAEKDPAAAPDADDLRDRQLRLIGTLKDDRARRDAQDAQDRDWRKADPTRVPAPVYLGDKVTISDSALSPDARWLVVVTQAKDAEAGTAGKMPKYVTESGYEEFEEVRTRVGRNAPVPHKLWLVDVAGGKVSELKYDALPGIADDPLAALRKAAKQDPLKGNRDVRIETDGDGSGPAIHWSGDSRNVAVLVRAIDNKDRWLASVDLATAKLQSLHRLHDEAWINWTFNEFDWLPDGSTLWFLSEQSGYSHLYLADGGKGRALTSGRWEVSSPKLSMDGNSFLFLCNRAWPGDYEVCSVPVAGGAVRELTALDGVESFVSSPDGSKLLVRHSDSYTPPQLAVVDANGDGVVQLTDTRKPAFKAREWIEPAYVQVPSKHGAGTVWGKYYGPKTVEPGRKYPIVMFVHGAGYLQNVSDRYPNYFREQMFHNLLVQHGYHRARPRLSRLRRLRPRLAHRDLPLDGQARTRGLPRRPGLDRRQQAGRSRPRRHLRRFLRRLHDVLRAVQAARRVQGRRRAAPGQRLVAVQPRVHGQHPQHAGTRSRGLPEVLADRIRRRPAGPPADRARHDRRQRLLQGLGDDDAEADRAAQGALDARAVSAGAAQLHASGQLVRRVPAHLRDVRDDAEVADHPCSSSQRTLGSILTLVAIIPPQ